MSAATVIAVASDSGHKSLKVTKFTIALAVMLLSGCAQEPEEHTQTETQIATTESVKKKALLSFDASCNSHGDTVVKSQLEFYLNPLSKLDDKYKFVRKVSVSIEDSIFNGMHEMSDIGLLPGTLEVSSFEYLISQILEANSMSIEGTNALTGNLYPRARIEEYIFSTPDCAQKAEKYLQWVNEHGPWGDSYYKAPTIISRDNHVIYHIVGAGEYMRSRLPIIEAVIITSEE